jgi:hypothetical protein
MGQNGANGSYQLTRIVQSGSLCADVVTALSHAMYTPYGWRRVETIAPGQRFLGNMPRSRETPTCGL